MVSGDPMAAIGRQPSVEFLVPVVMNGVSDRADPSLYMGCRAAE
jgi:hypothetical protein